MHLSFGASMCPLALICGKHTQPTANKGSIPSSSSTQQATSDMQTDLRYLLFTTEAEETAIRCWAPPRLETLRAQASTGVRH